MESARTARQDVVSVAHDHEWHANERPRPARVEVAGRLTAEMRLAHLSCVLYAPSHSPTL